jgi:uncharacterized protein YdeI (YjbR/CyaY-like superfamily)
VSTPNARVDAFVSRAKTWRREIQRLRSILLDCGLDEDLKWGKPCFRFQGKNVAIIQPFKQHCSLMFFKGALLQDTHGMLRSQGENTQSAMRLEFTSEVQVTRTAVESYVKAAIAVEKAGLKVDFKAKRELALPEELTRVLRKDRGLAQAFSDLTPGRRRAYLLHFTSAKQSQTRSARIDKCIPRIRAGMGMNDHQISTRPVTPVARGKAGHGHPRVGAGGRGADSAAGLQPDGKPSGRKDRLP